MTHRFSLRVYYEDTDLAGIVYYANYLRFIERGRTEMLRTLEVNQVRLKAEDGLIFVVRHVDADYLASGHFDDDLVVTTDIVTLGGARVELLQQVWRGETRLFSAKVTLVVVSDAGRAMRIPADIRQRLTKTGKIRKLTPV